ncbi:MAG TPA: tRNA 2-selenouridine(34) synthase MnmH [Ideonella sp.]|nr:tRNA 2-selenouridine(34) synthase MnmH [Ideonella sp.]
MSFSTLSVGEALAAPAPYDTLIDVRSPAEFADDHLPGAVNWPVLDDAERAHVGTVYTQVSTFEARKIGAALVSRRIAGILEQHVAAMPREWRPLVYCWRGGQRSGSLGLVLGQIGFRTRQLAGGYKAFRAQVREDLAAMPGRFELRVLAGRTGSGKTRLLGALAAAGGQTLDLEALAAHRGSVLGGLPTQPQPSQKRFETLLWQAMRTLDPARPVFVESESRRIGVRQLPDALLARIQQPALMVHVALPIEERARLLLRDYAFFTSEVEQLCERLQDLVALRGKAMVAHWQALARAQDWAALLPELMQLHYDPLYDKSTQRQRGRPAMELALPDTGEAALAAAARQLLA